MLVVARFTVPIAGKSEHALEENAGLHALRNDSVAKTSTYNFVLVGWNLFSGAALLELRTRG